MRRIRGRLGTARRRLVALAAAAGRAAPPSPAPRSRPPARRSDPRRRGRRLRRRSSRSRRSPARSASCWRWSQAGELAAAGARLDALVARYPDLAGLQANRAALAMRAGDDGAGARPSSPPPPASGFPDLAAVVADPLFAPLAADPRLAALAGPAAPPPAAPPVAGPGPGRRRAGHRRQHRLGPGHRAAGAPLQLPGRARGGRCCRRPPKAAAWDILREHVRARPRRRQPRRSLRQPRPRPLPLDPAAHPQVTRVAYSDAARAADVDYGLNDSLLFGRATFGNSSTALTGGPLWRSLPR